MKFATIRFDDENVLLISLDTDTKELSAILKDEINDETIVYEITVGE